MIKAVKLSVGLERQLTKIFAMATVAVVVAVLTGLYIANLQIRDAAALFISSHVKSLVAAGVNSQSVGDIDREVRRLYVAWSQAQKADLRISVSIDGVLVGKAGQLQPFGWLSSTAVETEKLASGQTMVLKTETDFSRSALREGILILFFVVCIWFGYLLLKRLIAQNIRSLTTPLEERMAWLKEVAQHLPDSVRHEILPANASVEEIVALDESLNSFVQQILRLESRVKEAGIKEGRVDMADRLAHALKGKLGVLRLRIENIPGLTLDEKRKLRESVNGLMMSSREMLESGRNGISPSIDFVEDENVLLASIVERAVRQRNEVANLCGQPVRLELSTEGRIGDFSISSSFATSFEDSLIAIVDNALEASADLLSGVQIHCQFEGEQARIFVRDSGCGIAPDVLPCLMKERATFGKSDGNGLGLFHASALLQKMGGRIEIESALGVGTTVTLIVPHSSPGNSFVYETAN